MFLNQLKKTMRNSYTTYLEVNNKHNYQNYTNGYKTNKIKQEKDEGEI